MDLTLITPLILTYNEEANIKRTLQPLGWAKRIVVVDSFSTDGTLNILRSYPQVEIVQRNFDHFSSQCNAGLAHIATPWVLSLDADYEVSEALVQEIRRLTPAPKVSGYSVPFIYRVFGKALRSTLYPPRTVLYRRDEAIYEQDGHAHRVSLVGDVESLAGPIYHDDRKPLDRWLSSQQSYTKAEVKKYRQETNDALSWPDKLRKWTLAPMVVFFYCLFGKRLIFDGAAGWYYTLQRTYAELLLALAILDEGLRTEEDDISS